MLSPNRSSWCGFVLAFLFLPSPFASAQPAPCDKTTGSEIVACVATAYPAKLAAGVSLEQRQANMAFLRDRVIETARCAGLDVGLNLKRGGPSISLDFVAWKNGAQLEGVDIAGSYDDVNKPLKLMWHRYSKAENFGHPFYKAYGPVSCVAPQPEPAPEPTPPVNTEIDALKTQIAALTNSLHSYSTNLTSSIQSLRDQMTQTNARIDELDGTLHGAILPTLETLKSRPIPDGCVARFTSCRLTFNGPK